MPKSLAIVCEAEADFRIASALAERALRERSLQQGTNWFEDNLSGCPLWRQFPTTNNRFLTWTEAKRLFRSRDLQASYDRISSDGETWMGRRALLVLRDLAPDLEGIVLMRDSDGHLERGKGLDQAREGWGVTVVVGLAHCKRESWALAGFEPENEDERSRLTELRRQLGYDPRTKAHQLDAVRDNAIHSAKRVLDFLINRERDRDRNREAKCWTDAPLQVLRERGGQTGLTAYLDEVHKTLGDLVLGPSGSR